MMQCGESAARARFRQAGRRVLRHPADADAHEARVLIACSLNGAEPAQGALADMAHGDAPPSRRLAQLLQSPEVTERLSPAIVTAFVELVHRNTALPQVTRLATRYSVLTMPSLDVPAHVILCSADDSRRVAAEAIPALLAGDLTVETTFLDHCEGALDVLGFMLARRALHKAHCELSPRWREVSDVLQRGVGL